MTDRRTFLQTAGTAAIGFAGLGLAGCAGDDAATAQGTTAPADTADTANASATADGAPLQTLGVQLYTVRTLMEEDLPGTLQQVAEVGYGAVETAGFFDRTPQQFRTLLDEAGLRSPAGHYPLEDIQDDPNGLIETAQTLGQNYLVCPYLGEEDRTSLDDYRAHADTFNQFGERCQSAGLQFAYHNHAFEFESFGGDMPAYDLLLERTDPALVQMELDLFWIVEAGYDPLAYFEQYPGRFPLFHVKDRTAGGDMVAVGEGAIDFSAILAQAEQAGLAHAFVEHDNPDEPLASIRASYQHLEQLAS